MNKWVKAGVFLVIIGIVTIVVSIVTGADTSFYWDRDGHFRSSRDASREIADLEDWDGQEWLKLEKRFPDWERWFAEGAQSGREVSITWEADFDEQEWTKLEKRFPDWERWFAEGARPDRAVAVTSQKLGAIKTVDVGVTNSDVRLVKLEKGEPSFVAYEAYPPLWEVTEEDGTLQVRSGPAARRLGDDETWHVLIGLDADTLPSLQLQSDDGDFVLEGLVVEETTIYLTDSDAVLSKGALKDGELTLWDGDLISHETALQNLAIELHDGDMIASDQTITGTSMTVQDGDVSWGDVELVDVRLQVVDGEFGGTLAAMEDVSIDVDGGMVLNLGEIKGKNDLRVTDYDVFLTVPEKVWNGLNCKIVGREITIDDQQRPSPYELTGQAGSLEVHGPDAWVQVNVEN